MEGRKEVDRNGTTRTIGYVFGCVARGSGTGGVAWELGAAHDATDRAASSRLVVLL